LTKSAAADPGRRYFPFGKFRNRVLQFNRRGGGACGLKTAKPRTRGETPVCPGCGIPQDQKAVSENLKTCPACGYHFRMEPAERVKYLADDGSFTEFSANLSSLNPIDLSGYREPSGKTCPKASSAPSFSLKKASSI
jgi:hypothetical protein